MITSAFIRLTLFPLVVVQMKRFAKLGPHAPTFTFLKDTWNHSEMTFQEKVKTVKGIYK